MHCTFSKFFIIFLNSVDLDLLPSSEAKTLVTPGGVSTALPRSCLIFQSTVRTQENHDIFREKLSVLTATKALQRSSHGVLSRSYGVHGGDSLHSYGVFTVRSRRSQRMRHAFTALPLR